MCFSVKFSPLDNMITDFHTTKNWIIRKHEKVTDIMPAQSASYCEGQTIGQIDNGTQFITLMEAHK